VCKLLTVFDNGSGKRGQPCDDCGTMLRYEYHLDDGSIYGSCCVKAHLDHSPNWLTLRAANDARTAAKIETGKTRQLAACLQRNMVTCTVFRDGSAVIDGISRYSESGTMEAIEALVTMGWVKTRTGSGYMPGSSKYILRRG
jgi:hypothetical protein